ncbi:MAG: hypothetical protein ACTSSE_06665 [Candidatus Thorarchaeota archaeon]
MIPDLFHPEVENDDNKVRMESLGLFVNEQNRPQFERMLRETTWSGVIDISGWTVDAVKALVTVYADENLSITIKRGSCYFMPIRFPKGPLLDSFAESIVLGNF